MSSKKLTAKEKLEKYVDEDQKLLDKHKVLRSIVFAFPQKRVPLLARLAMKILAYYKARTDIRIFPKPKEQ